VNEVKVAKKLCMKAHSGQVDKAGKPYYLHPFAVAEMCSTKTEKVVAYLHDIVEDTSISLEDLKRFGFNRDVIEAVQLLTHNVEQSNEFKNRLCLNVSTCKGWFFSGVGGGGDELFGQVDYIHKEICLNAGASEEQKKETLLHEIIHAMDEKFRIGLKKRQVEQLGVAICNLVRDNPEMFCDDRDNRILK